MKSLSEPFLRSTRQLLLRARGALFVLALFATPALPVQPDEMLKEPALEARARSLSAGFRCLVCQNQSIDESDAPLARDLRILIREQLQSGKSDAEVTDFVVNRYGEYVLLKPPFSGPALLLWLTPFALLLGAAAFLWQRRQPIESAATLSEAEERRLAAILRDQNRN